MKLVLQGGAGSGAWIKQLRVLRAFRLFRLFGKMGQLKRIVTAVALSIVPTLQALVRQSERGGWERGVGRDATRGSTIQGVCRGGGRPAGQAPA